MLCCKVINCPFRCIDGYSKYSVFRKFSLNSFRNSRPHPNAIKEKQHRDGGSGVREKFKTVSPVI